MENKKWTHHLMAGGIAGISDAIVCHPLDTIKTRIQINPKIQIFLKLETKYYKKKDFLRFIKV